MHRPSLVVLLLAGAVLAGACGGAGAGNRGSAALSPGPLRPAPTVAPTTVPPPPPVVAPPLPLAGCPPPPRPPGGVTPGPAYVPPVLVPESELPAPVPPGQWTPDLAPLGGKGMWVWQYTKTEGGNMDGIVAKAAAAGLRQLWVRVGDTENRFYARDQLAALVPRAHARGIAVIGWGFPYLFDPVADAAWSAAALAWRTPAGDALDGFSPDVEMSTEGVALSDLRVRVYLGLVRQAARGRLVVATVYRPSDRLWPDLYPYAAMAPYVDAFAPMVYWGCLEPGAATAQAIERLGTLKPVHVVGQAFDSAATGGRTAAPSDLETRRFLDVAARDGGLGASFWVWQLMDDEQWSALSAFPWTSPG